MLLEYYLLAAVGAAGAYNQEEHGASWITRHEMGENIELMCINSWTLYLRLLLKHQTAAPTIAPITMRPAAIPPAKEGKCRLKVWNPPYAVELVLPMIDHPPLQYMQYMLQIVWLKYFPVKQNAATLTKNWQRDASFSRQTWSASLLTNPSHPSLASPPKKVGHRSWLCVTENSGEKNLAPRQMYNFKWETCPPDKVWYARDCNLIINSAQSSEFWSGSQRCKRWFGLDF